MISENTSNPFRTDRPTDLRNASVLRPASLVLRVLQVLPDARDVRGELVRLRQVRRLRVRRHLRGGCWRVLLTCSGYVGKFLQVRAVCY